MVHRAYLTTAVAILLLAGARVRGVEPTTRKTDRAREIQAKCWFNPQPTNLFDPPELILLEFWAVRSPDSRKVNEAISALHSAYDGGRLLVVGLTADACKDAQRFVRGAKVEYKIGAESSSLKRYGVHELPTVLLIDPENRRIVGRWSGQQIKTEVLARAIQELLGPPAWVGIAASTRLSSGERAELTSGFASADAGLGAVTERTLSGDGPLGPEHLWALDQFYWDTMPVDGSSEDLETRASNYARRRMLDEDTGYGKLVSGERLSDAGRMAIRDRVLDMARDDPSDGVRICAIHALRKSIGRPGDATLLDALRNMRASMGGVGEGKGNPLIRASLDQALAELDPTTRSAELQQRRDRPMGRDLHRMLNKAGDPASSQWADAHAYKKTVRERSTEQLFEDYWSYPDPPDDEVGRQNATLKRDEALGEIGNRLVRGEIRDLSMVKDHLTRALSQEPDEWVRRGVVSGLRAIARRRGGGVRREIIDLFEKRLGEEPARLVQARIEIYLDELRAQ